MEHVHKDLIIAWAKGAQIEYYSDTHKKWIETDTPAWDQDVEYRIKAQSTGWIKVDGVRPEHISSNQKVEWYSADGRMNKCCIGALNFGKPQKDPNRVMFIRILKDE